MISMMENYLCYGLSCSVEASDFFRDKLRWREIGVNHSFGRQRWKKGMHELTYASLFIQLGISCPHKILSQKFIKNILILTL